MWRDTEFELENELEAELDGLNRELEQDAGRSFESEWEGEEEGGLGDELEMEALYKGPGRPAASTPPVGPCPAPAQVARDRCKHPGTQTCPAIPNLLCLRDAAGAPFEYVISIGTDPTTRLKIVTRRRTPSVEKFIPSVRNALNNFASNMSRFAMPIEAILTVGSLYCRCVTNSDNLSNHSFGDAIDVAGVRWPQVGGPASTLRETIVHNWTPPGGPQRALLRRINACLRLSFNTVIDYHRPDHRDHFHCDTNSRGGNTRAMGRSTTTPHFVQEALTHVLGRPIAETGNWDRPTMQGLQEFSGVTAEELKDQNRLNQVLDQLFARVAADIPAASAAPMGLDRFPFDSSSLTAYHHGLIDRIARRVVASAGTDKPVRVVYLVGHADSRGSPSYNQALGLRRSRVVQAALARAIGKVRPGVARAIRFVTHSQGATQPVAPSATAAGRARNRRVALSLNLPPAAPARQAELPGYEAYLEAPAPSTATPPLLYSESMVPKETHYVSITLGGEKPAPPMTGVFVPKDYRNPSQVDLILYLQGHHKGTPNLSIDTYWFAARYPYWAFREGVNGSKKNVILVAPTLGPGSEAGKLADPGGLAWYLDQVLPALRTYGPFKAMSDPPSMGNIIIACHSGGGFPMRKIALTPQKYLDNVRQFWGFDCLYNAGDETLWVDWARANPTKQLFIHFGNGGTAARSRRLQDNAKGLSNVSVDGSESVPHDRVPITHWFNRLRAARFLLDT